VWRSVGIELFFAEKRYATKDRFRMLKKTSRATSVIKKRTCSQTYPKQTALTSRIARMREKDLSTRMRAFSNSCKLTSTKVLKERTNQQPTEVLCTLPGPFPL